MNKIFTAAIAAAFALSATSAIAGSPVAGTGDAMVDDDMGAFVPVGSLGGAAGTAVVAGVAGLALLAAASSDDDDDDSSATTGEEED